MSPCQEKRIIARADTRQMKANDGQRVREKCEIRMLPSGKVVEEWYEAEDDEASVSIVNGKDKNKNEVSL